MANKWVTVTNAGRQFVLHCEVCNARAMAHDRRGIDDFIRDHDQHRSAAPGHYGLGDAVARMTSAVGVEPCTPCERRRMMLNGPAPRLRRRSRSAGGRLGCV